MSAGTFDLDPDSRAALELDAVLDYAASFAASAPGRALVLALAPSSDPGRLASEHRAIEEASVHLERLGRLLPGRLPEPRTALAALRVEGGAVETVSLRDLASVLLEAADLGRRLGGLPEGSFPALRDLGRELPDLTALARPVVDHVAPDGRISEEASPELRRLRQAIVRTGERLRHQLESFVHDPASASVVRDEFVTQRNGRFVIPVRADAPKGVDGIVHAASSSGQTLFVEPIASVALNNDLVRLQEEEAAERERIVRGWADRLRRAEADVARAVDGIARADGLQARALFGAAISGVRPELAGGAPLALEDVRHPLLDRRLREEGRGAVPLTLTIDPCDRVLVLSGPNTGGKTVALKTIGLAVLMAQSGLPVAAASARLPLFAQLRADIGDHQSIDADLSTFSAHVRTIARCLDEVAPPALLLFDEIGTGTEPGEGAALARAILERVAERRITTVATTHHAAVKAWAFSDPRIDSAALEFDSETLRPTYRVLPGTAGTSAGIDVASRLGLDAALLARARALAGTEAVQAEGMMARLRDLTAEAAERAARLGAAEASLEVERARLAERARAEREKRSEEARRSLDAALASFREDAAREIASVRDARERARLTRAQVRAEGRLRDRARRAVPAEPAARAAPALDAPLAPGRRVRIVSLDREGEVVRVRGERVEVRMGSATFTVRRDDLAAAGPETGAPEKGPGRAAPPGGRLAALAAASRGAGEAEASEAPPLELHLIGRTVDEALPELDRFLDATAREGRTDVRVVHGHGTGRLRSAVRRFLKGHPLVAGFRAGGPGEGGDGATVVTLR